jgi:gamma-glutamyltranspeptidase / glutathione hydrolase / leukotriene-C4 hydrolase
METKEVETINQIPTKDYARRIYPNITDGHTHTPEYYQPMYDVPINQGTVRHSYFSYKGALTERSESHEHP